MWWEVLRHLTKFFRKKFLIIFLSMNSNFLVIINNKRDFCFGVGNKMIRFAINMNFRWRIPLYVTVVSLKESWDTRISLNVVRSTQIFSEVLYKSSYFISKRCRIKMLKKYVNNKSNNILDNTCWISDNGFLLCHISFW